MKKILLATMLLIVALSLMATAHTVSALTVNWVDGQLMFSSTTAFTDSTTEQIAYIDTPAYSGAVVCGKVVLVTAVITTTVAQGGASPEVAKLMPIVYASSDGTTYVKAKVLSYARSAALTTGTSTQYVIDLRGFYAPFIKIYYVGTGTSDITIGTGAVSAGKLINILSVQSDQLYQ